MRTDLLELVVVRLRTGPNGICETVGSATGVYPGTVRKMKQGRVTNPRWLTLKPIVDYFLANGGLEPSQPSGGCAK